MHLHIYSYAVSTPSKLWHPSLYSKELEVRILKMPDYSQLGTSVTKYDSIQDDLDTLAAMDDLLAGGEDGDQSIIYLCYDMGGDFSTRSLFIKNFLFVGLRTFACSAFFKLSALIKNANNYSFSLFFCKLLRH